MSDLTEPSENIFPPCHNMRCVGSSVYSVSCFKMSNLRLQISAVMSMVSVQCMTSSFLRLSTFITSATTSATDVLMFAFDTTVFLQSPSQFWVGCVSPV